MANLFFIHTPMQLFVAQQLIYQEKLENNYMLYGYNGAHKNFLKTYDLMLIESMWKEKIFMEKLDQWAALGFGNLNTFRTILRNYKRIKSLIKHYSIDKIFFGDIDNFSHQFGTIVFSKDCKIVFFEEGSSQYTYINHLPEKNYLKIVSSWVLDILFYLPIFHFSFGRYRRYVDVKNNQLPIFQRFSIVPNIHNESYDRILNINFVVSDKLQELIRNELEALEMKKNKIFLITSDVYAGPQYNERYPVYLKVIEDYLKTLDKESFILLKLHPSEGLDKKKDLDTILKNIGINYFVLSSKVNIPVEYYLQYFEPREIVHFMSSTIFYNGYIYPKCSDTNLFVPFFKKCIDKGVNMDDLNGLNQACIKI